MSLIHILIPFPYRFPFSPLLNSSSSFVSVWLVVLLLVPNGDLDSDMSLESVVNLVERMQFKIREVVFSLSLKSSIFCGVN